MQVQNFIEFGHVLMLRYKFVCMSVDFLETLFGWHVPLHDIILHVSYS